MRLIDADTVVTFQTYDDMYEEWGLETMTVAKALDKFSEEGCPPTIEAVPVVHCKDCKYYNRALRLCNKGLGSREFDFYCADGERKDADHAVD